MELKSEYGEWHPYGSEPLAPEEDNIELKNLEEETLYYARITAKGVNGKLSVPSEALSFTARDILPPVIKSFETSVSRMTFDAKDDAPDTLLITWSINEPCLISIAIEDNNMNQVRLMTTSTYIQNGQWIWDGLDKDGTKAAEGIYAIRLNATDIGGGSAPEASLSVEVLDDVTCPEAPVVIYAPKCVNKNIAGIKGTKETGTGIRLKMAGRLKAMTGINDEDVWDLITGLKDGPNIIELSSVDSKMRLSQEVGLYIEVDKVIPDINVMGLYAPPYGNKYMNYFNRLVEWHVTAYDMHPGALIVKVDGAVRLQEDSDAVKGRHIMEITAYDEAGNTASKELSYVLDYDGPVIELVEYGDTGSNNIAPVRLKYNDHLSPYKEVRFRLAGSGDSSWRSGAENKIWGNNVVSDTNTEINATIGPFTNGAYNIELQAVDLSGNEGNISPLSVSLYTDFRMELLNYEEYTNKDNMELLGTLISGNSHITGILYRLDGPPHSWYEGIPLDGKFDYIREEFSLKLPRLLDGSHTLAIRAYLEDGRELAETLPLIVDTKPPVSLFEGNKKVYKTSSPVITGQGRD